MSQENMVDIRDLEVKFYTYAGVVEALDGVNLFIKRGEILGLVGETGCGKSVTSLSIMMLIPPPGKIVGGRILYKHGSEQGNILAMSADSLRRLRGKDIAMIFQEPRAYLNPVYTVEDQIGEVILVHRRKEILQNAVSNIEKKLVEDRRLVLEKQRVRFEKQKAGNEKDKVKLEEPGALLEKEVSKLTVKPPSNFEVGIYERLIRSPRSRSVAFQARFSRKRQFKKELRKEVVRVLRSVEIPDAERVARMYPHELSGGMAQRVLIAMALSCNPTLLIADEPTTNLDVTVQAQILNLIVTLKNSLGSSILYITHDLGVVAQSCERVAVMYAGNVVETADVFETFSKPLHPYTRALLKSIPRPGEPYKSIAGIVPSLVNPLRGCRFHDRCEYAMEICRKTKPPFLEVKPGHYVACHLYGGLK
jgi:peptide/nickel transport system ATP-binding protein